MIHSPALLVFGCAFFWLAAAPFSPVPADDEHRGHSERHGHREHSERQQEAPVAPATNARYKETCGACHAPYQPWLLPSASWNGILTKLDDHFGQAVALDPEARKEVSDYLNANAADRSSAKSAKRIMRSLGTSTPARITEVPYIHKQHAEICDEVFARASVGSRSNCSACHQQAEAGIFDDDHVKIPK
jgi:hypothetical protein